MGDGIGVAMSLLLLCQQNVVTNHLSCESVFGAIPVLLANLTRPTLVPESTERTRRTLANAVEYYSQAVSTCHINEIRLPPS